MSADNWRKCPKCGEAAEKKVAAIEKKARDAYGKVPPEEYAAGIEAAKRVRGEGVSETLREDYEFYYEKPFMLTVSYACSCRECYFAWSMKQTFDTRINSAKER